MDIVKRDNDKNKPVKAISTEVMNTTISQIQKDTPKLMAELVSVLGQIVVDFAFRVGISKFGDNKTKDDIMYFILKYFSELRVWDIQVALEMVVANKIEVPSQQHHYGKLTPFYISAILREYKKHRSLLIRTGKYPFELKQIAVASTKEKSISVTIKEVILFKYQIFIETGQVDFVKPAIYYEWLEENDYIQMSGAVKQNLIERAKIKATLKAKKPKGGNLLSSTVFKQCQNFNVDNIWKKLALIDLFESWKELSVNPVKIFDK